MLVGTEITERDSYQATVSELLEQLEGATKVNPRILCPPQLQLENGKIGEKNPLVPSIANLAKQRESPAVDLFGVVQTLLVVGDGGEVS